LSDAFELNAINNNALANKDNADDESEDEKENIEDSQNFGSYIVKMRSHLNEFFKKVSKLISITYFFYQITDRELYKTKPEFNFYTTRAFLVALTIYVLIALIINNPFKFFSHTNSTNFWDDYVFSNNKGFELNKSQ